MPIPDVFLGEPGIGVDDDLSQPGTYQVNSVCFVPFVAHDFTGLKNLQVGMLPDVFQVFLREIIK